MDRQITVKVWERDLERLFRGQCFLVRRGDSDVYDVRVDLNSDIKAAKAVDDAWEAGE